MKKRRLRGRLKENRLKMRFEVPLIGCELHHWMVISQKEPAFEAC
jgi:hypothetical protein